ncbi:hypothetical protein CBR_g44453 [Chara braunii]|uniref:Uncharacterized protein n=1 Tax=Chara braunii TaxID=69332 RepID=A0A388LXE8_CHABU|nr:hypothetical protein CBR_g44453 [Chara braunii]|eukprot:GBG86998.1 hypothetical protein CBR_g44453 [Chara braunii]
MEARLRLNRPLRKFGLVNMMAAVPMVSLSGMLQGGAQRATAPSAATAAAAATMGVVEDGAAVALPLAFLPRYAESGVGFELEKPVIKLREEDLDLIEEEKTDKAAEKADREREKRRKARSGTNRHQQQQLGKNSSTTSSSASSSSSSSPPASTSTTVAKKPIAAVLSQTGAVKLRVRVGNSAVKRLLSGALAGVVSRTAVAPLETIRTHLMVGSGGKTVNDVFVYIMKNEGWTGLFRANGVNVLRVAPSKAIELFAYDTVKKILAPPGMPPQIPFPIAPVAGASAGVCSTLCTYPLELLKTRLTVQKGMYDNMLDAFVKIWQTEGPMELYRGLLPSIMGVVPYAAINYCAYDTLRSTYRRLSKKQQIGNLETLLMGSTAGVISSAATFPLEVARKHMQVGAVSGRQVYKNMFQVISHILQEQGPAGLYRGLGASCMKLMPACGISFMCYEACKRILIEDEVHD